MQHTKTLHQGQQDMFEDRLIMSFTASGTKLVSAQLLQICSGGIDAALQYLASISQGHQRASTGIY